MKRPNGSRAIACRLPALRPSPDYRRQALHPGATPDAVLAALYALVDAHHGEASPNKEAADPRAHHSDRLAALRSATAIHATQGKRLFGRHCAPFSTAVQPGSRSRVPTYASALPPAASDARPARTHQQRCAGWRIRQASPACRVGKRRWRDRIHVERRRRCDPRPGKSPFCRLRQAPDRNDVRFLF